MTLRENCKKLLHAYKEWYLWHMAMPEDVHPVFCNDEEKLTYFTLPMALNYQRNSYALWEAAIKTYNDADTNRIFDIEKSAQASTQELHYALVKYKVALQPTRHIAIWSTIAQTISAEWKTVSNLIHNVWYDFLKLQQVIQVQHKKWFPYLSWPKIFHYWSYILGEYCHVKLSNKQFIEIAPDTHVIQCSVRLWVLTPEEATKLSREQISQRRRDVLSGTWIDPIDMHSPLRFWSRNGFEYEL